jgi:hypothetical protein
MAAKALARNLASLLSKAVGEKKPTTPMEETMETNLKGLTLEESHRFLNLF